MEGPEIKYTSYRNKVLLQQLRGFKKGVGKTGVFVEICVRGKSPSRVLVLYTEMYQIKIRIKLMSGF